jgi:DNA-directed RNA polymerase specialized sigma24 family protein
MEQIKVESIDMEKELAEVRGLIKENSKFTKQAIMEIRQYNFNLSEKMDKLDKQQQEFVHSMNLLIEACKQLSEEQNKVYSGKDMYKMFKVEGMTHAQIAKRCGCSVSTVKRHINEYKNSIFDMEV